MWSKGGQATNIAFDVLQGYEYGDDGGSDDGNNGDNSQTGFEKNE